MSDTKSSGTGGNLADLTAAINRLAAAIEGSNQQAVRTNPRAFLPPAPKGHTCVTCGHMTPVHREAGCDVSGCGCPAPFGRLMPPPEVPNDLSSLDGAA